jgi:hypothetical protein
MSYGKNDSHLTRIGGYGATASQQMGNATRRQQGPKKGSPSWANNFQPSEGSPDYIRLIPGNFQADRVNSETGQAYIEEVPWFECAEHFHGTNKQSIMCSAGINYMNQKLAEPCRGCDIWHEDMAARKEIEQRTGVKPQGPNRIGRSSKYVFLVLDMAWFFKGFRLDEHGRVKVNQNTGKPFEDWIKYNEAHHNEYLYASGEASRQGKQLEMRHGMVQTWPVGFNQFGTLSGFADIVQKHCRSCGGQNCVHTSGWSCPNCNAPTITTSLPPDEVKKLVSKAVYCSNCKTMAYPRPIMVCTNCPNPMPATLYDVDMQVQNVRVNKNRQLIIPWMSNPRPVDPEFAEAMKKIPDVLTKFAPTSMEEQIAKFGHPPQSAQAPAPQQWGQPQQPPQQGWQQPQQAFQPQQQPWQQPAAQQPQWGQPAHQPQWGGQPTQAWGQPQQQPQYGFNPHAPIDPSQIPF